MNSKVIRTFASPDYLLKTLEKEYGLKSSSGVKALKLGGSNDIYKLEDSKRKKYIVKIYSKRQCWPYEEDHYTFELRVQKFLSEAGFGVPEPIPSRRGKLLSSIDLPEGKKIYALYNFVEGVKWNHKCTQERRLQKVGESLAHLHTLLEHFHDSTIRRKLDIMQLLDRSWESISGEVKLPNESIKERLEAVYRNLTDLVHEHQLGANELVLIHGDMHAGNNLLDQKGQKLYFLDFELCGYGYLSYEFATMKWDLHHSHKRAFVERCMKEFLDGYNVVRPVERSILDQIDHFVLLRQFFILGSSFLFYPDRPQLNSEYMLDYYLRTFDKFLKISDKPSVCPSSVSV